MTRQRLAYKEGLYAESLVVVVTEALVTLILRRVGAKHLIGIGTQTTTDDLVLCCGIRTQSHHPDIVLSKVAQHLTGLLVELAVQRIDLTILRREVSTTDRSDAIVRT